MKLSISHINTDQEITRHVAMEVGGEMALGNSQNFKNMIQHNVRSCFYEIQIEEGEMEK